MRSLALEDIGPRAGHGVSLTGVTTSTWSAASASTLVDPTLKRIVILFRVLGWAWMLVLVIFGLTAPPGSEAHIGRPEVAWAALAVATGWTLFSVWAAATDRLVRTLGFVVVDLIVAATVGAASLLADTAELFHGGFTMSWVLFAAYGGGFRWAMPGALLLGVEQWFVRIGIGRSASGAAFAIVFPFLAVVAGWGFDAVRDHSARRSQAEARLAEARASQARLEERAELANKLHDSVLQTLYAIRRDADDSGQVVYLARRQERELRRTIEQFRSPFGEGFRVALLAARDEVEDVHRIEIDAIVKGDTALTDELRTLVDAAREAMVNAAKHSGVDKVDVYAEVGADRVEVMVRDRGSGFELGTSGAGHGLGAMAVRVDGAGGTVDVVSAPGEGTEVKLTLGTEKSAPS